MKTKKAVDIIWNYMQLRQPIMPADVLVLLGSRDDRVASYAATLLQNNVAPICVVTGGIAHGHDLLATKWAEESEADHFINVLHAEGVKKNRIYKENAATNTGQNATLSYKVLTEHRIEPKSILIVTKPYMERRALATFLAQWPHRKTAMRVSSASGTVDAYCNDDQPFDVVVNIMVGDFQRLVEYPKRRLMIAQQSIPADVVAAYDDLVAAGYTHHLI